MANKERSLQLLGIYRMPVKLGVEVSSIVGNPVYTYSVENIIQKLSLHPIWKCQYFAEIVGKFNLIRKSAFRAENFRMVDIRINAWSSLFDNLKINIILQDYLKSVWKTIKFKLIFNHLRNCSSQSEKSGQLMREQKYSHWRKQLTDIQGERNRVD